MKTSDELKKAMKMLDIQKLRQHQIEPINALNKGKDCFIVLPTSAGKSAIPQLVGLMKPGYTLNITPTLSLMVTIQNPLTSRPSLDRTARIGLLGTH